MDISRAIAELPGLIPGLAAVYLYGSHARGDARAGSDVDLAVLSDRGPIPRAALHAARERMEDRLNVDVDLVDLQESSTILAREVMAEGRRILAPAAFYADLFEVRVLRDYADLKERRAGIEADIAARGRVFGGDP